MKDYIDLTILMDCSGSMQTIKNDMEGALIEMLDKQKQFNDVCVSLYTFNDPDSYREVFVGKPIKDVEKIELNPKGMTALIDAWCKTIDKTGDRFSKMDESNRPSKVLFVVITDGEENSSTEFCKKTLEEKIKTQEETYNWKFDYLGANQVAKDVARNQYGTHQGRTMSFDASTSGVHAMYCSVARSMDMMRDGTYQAEDN